MWNMAMLQPIIGLDFGTSTTCAAVLQNGKIEFVKGKYGNDHVIPSCIVFTPDKGKEGDSVLVGKIASSLDQLHYNSFVFGMKKLLGKEIHDPAVTCNSYMYPFEIVGDRNKLIAIKVKDEGTFSPDEISAMYLSKIKENAEKMLATEVSSAVVTVPSSYGFWQRQRIRDACAAAGLNVAQLIDEATAVALANGRANPAAAKGHVLVVNVGAAFVSVSLVLIEYGRSYRVKAVTGHPDLGGNKFDIRVTSYMVEQIRDLMGIDVTHDNKVMMRRLRKGAIALKEALTNHEQAKVNISLETGGGVDLSMTRTEFEKLNANLLSAILEPVRRTLEDAQVKKEDIDRVVLAGGSTRIPKVQKLISSFFNEKALTFSFNDCSTLPAIGAAVLAANLQGHEDAFIRDLIQVTPHSIGVETSRNKMTNIIDRNSEIPTRATKTFTTFSDFQSKALITIYEGDGASSRDNVKLGQYILKSIREEPCGFPEIDVTVEYDQQGDLAVKVVNISSKQEGVPFMITLESVLEKPHRDRSKTMAIVSRIPTDGRMLDDDFKGLNIDPDMQDLVAEDLQQDHNRPTVPPHLHDAKSLDSGLNFPPLLERRLKFSLLSSLSSKHRHESEAKRKCSDSSRPNMVESGFEQSEQYHNDVQHALTHANSVIRRLSVHEKEAIHRAEAAEIQAIKLEKERDLALKKLQNMEEEIGTLVEKDSKLRLRLAEVTEQADVFWTQYNKVREILIDKEADTKDPLALDLWVVQEDEIKLSVEEVGRGGWGIVEKAMFRGTCVAAKRIHNHILSDYNRELFQREMSIASRIRHPNLVQFIGATAKGEPIILTELMSTSVWEQLQQRPFTQPHITSIGVDVARGLNYLHLMRPDPILHRDVSSSNVLLNHGPNHTWIAKLSDYGSANYVCYAVTKGPGNAAYAAPEIVQTPKMDVYSYGILLLEMCTRKIPDSTITNHEPLILTVLPVKLQKLIRICINYDFNRRPTMSVVIEDLDVCNLSL